MLAVLFGLAVLASLCTTAMIGLDILPASPLVMSVVFLAHAVFALGFFRGYSGYRALHRLVHEGRGELYDIAISHRIRTNWFKAFREHYLLRRVEGLALCGLSLRALDAAEAHRRDGRAHLTTQLAVTTAEVEANLTLGRLAWAVFTLETVKALKGSERHPGLQAVRGRLAHLRGDHALAVTLLEPLQRAGEWPLKRVVEARNNAWYGEALGALSRHGEAQVAFERAARVAPRSYWGKQAARSARLAA